MSNFLKSCILWICLQSSFPVVDCQSLRLTGRSTANRGRLEIYLDGKWGTVQSSLISYKDKIAKVACRELGYRGFAAAAEPVRPAYGRRKLIGLRYVRCSGNEPSLLNCTHSRVPSSYSWYSHDNDVAIFCLNTTTERVPLRLMDGQAPNKGRLEIQLNAEWHTVCVKRFDPIVAKVACWNMGYRGVARILASLNQITYSNGVELGSLSCTGSESFLLDCVRGQVAIHSCPKEAFNIICTNQTAVAVPMRLLDGKTSNSGRLEIQLDGSWGSVCRSSFDVKDAKVACHSMGYSGIGTRIKTIAVNSSMWLYGLDCKGNESHLLDCPYSGDDRPKCGPWDGVEIICTNHTTESFPLRLSDALTTDSGRLEVQIGGVWGTVCSKQFDITAAHVTCRHLGYSGADGIGGVMDQDAYLGPVPVWINNVQCTGKETSLSSCSYSQNKIDQCLHQDDVAVRCRHSSNESFSLRLADGEAADSGRLEMQVDGVWGSVCKDHFGQEEATVACRNLGYWKFHRFLDQHTPVRPTVPVWLDNVECTGSESHLIECAHNGLGIHNCTHADDVAIKCLQKNAVSARLQKGLSENMGRLEMRVDGVWGSVCNRHFDYRDASVACRMLGYTGVYAIMNRMDEVRSDSVLSIWLDNLNCSGSESHLLDCPHSGIGVHNCSHGDDVGLKCLTHDPVSLRLMEGLTPNSGRLELEIDGVWRTVCRCGFGQRDAAVACSMLGYNGTALALVTTERQRAPRSPLWMYDMRCNGSESSLLDCPHEIKHPSDQRLKDRCSRRNDISIMCLTSEATQEVTVRLVDAREPNRGRLEIELDGVWGSVCGNGFTVSDATVACRMLGYMGRSYYSSRSRTSPSRSSPQWLDGLQCNGTETSLLDCDHTIVDSSPCTDIHIECTGLASGV